MSKVMISGSGVYTPPESITNEELVTAFNDYAALYNQQHAAKIEQGEIEALRPSSATFIENASGIKNRHVLFREGILDPQRMCPIFPKKTEDEWSYQCEVGVKAAQQALAQAGRAAEEVDAVLAACSNFERPYPAVATEIQAALGSKGFSYDMNIACSSATFAIQAGVDAITNGNATCVLVVNPEICSGHLNFKDRDSHFIFGDVATAVLLESVDSSKSSSGFEILGTKLFTQFSNNIRNDAGFLNRTYLEAFPDQNLLFRQQGKRVFKDVVPIVSEFIKQHLAAFEIGPSQIKRFWLHQANLAMNRLITKKILGHEADSILAPVILDDYANTSSAGAIVAFHHHKENLRRGDLGLICSFGAGYSVGSVVLQKM